MKAKLKRIIPWCLVAIFFVIALVAKNIPTSNAQVKDEELKNVKAILQDNGNFLVSGLNSNMEYSYTLSNKPQTWKAVDGKSEKILSKDGNFFVKKIGNKEVKTLILRKKYPIEFSWNIDSNKEKVITLGMKPKDTIIEADGTYIDWGDGNVEFLEYTEKGVFKHTYTTENTTVNVKIADNKIEYLDCDNQEVNALNVDYAGELKEIHCNNNQIATLNLKNNSMLEKLYCNGNNFTNLELINNPYLTNVSCVKKEGNLKLTLLPDQFIETDINKVQEGTNVFESQKVYVHPTTEIATQGLKIPSEPNVKPVKNSDNKTWRIDGVDNTMEYNSVSEGYSGKWTKLPSEELKNIKFNETYYIRKSATKTNTVGPVKSLLVKVVDLKKNVREDDSETITIIGMTTEMEYKKNQEQNWTNWKEGDLVDISETCTYYIRMINDPTTTLVYNIELLVRPEAPNITSVKNEDNTYNLSGIDSTMEYHTETMTTWAKCNPDNFKSLSNSETYYIRYPQKGNTPSSKILILVVEVEEKPVEKTYTVTYDANGGIFESQAVNTLTYDIKTVGTKISKTPNVSEDGKSNTVGYEYGRDILDEVTIPGADLLEVTITYETEDIQADWVAIYNKELNPTQTNYNESISGKLAGTIKTTKTIIVPGDTAKFLFSSSGRAVLFNLENNMSDCYGYYAEVKGKSVTKLSGEYKVPTNSDKQFFGWSLDKNLPKVQYSKYEKVIPNDNMTLYAVWDMPVESLQIGSYIQYTPSTLPVTIFGDETGAEVTQIFNPDAYTEGWKVFKKNGNQIDIISAESVGKLTLGKEARASSEDDTSLNGGKIAYAKAISTLNKICKGYATGRIAETGRCLGYSNQKDIDVKNVTHSYVRKEIEEGRLTLPYEPFVDNGYKEDENIINTAINNKYPLKNNVDNIWIASREFRTSDNSSDFCIRTYYASDFFSAYNLYNASSSSQANSRTGINGIRPVISLKSGLKVVDGDGTKANPYVLEEINLKPPVEVEYTVTLNGNGVELTTTEMTFKKGESQEIYKPEREGYNFLGWGISAGATEYVENPYTAAGDVTLYAIWEKIEAKPDPEPPVKETYTITFNANGGTGEMTSQEFNKNEEKELSANKFKKEGYLFAGWSTEENGKVEYKDQEKYKAKKSVRLYAIWEKATFEITVVVGNHGEVTPSGVITVNRGSNKEIKITPDSGYEVSYVKVDGKDIGEVYKYEFKNITSNHKLEVIFEKKYSHSGGGGNGGGGSIGGGSISRPNPILNSSWKNKFTDVQKDAWYYDVVKFVNDRNYFKGMTETTFGPDIPMTREMFMMALYNVDRNPITYGANNYTDVPSGHWSEKAIVWGNAKGLIKGFPDGSFRPAKAITRQEVATIMKNYAEYKFQYTANRKELTTFNDHKDVYDWAYDSISWAVARGIMRGDNYNCILPQKSATRAEVAAMIMNYIKSY